MAAEEERILRRTSQNVFDGFFDRSEILGRKTADRSRREPALIECANLVALEERWVFQTVFPSWFDSDNVLEMVWFSFGRSARNNQDRKPFRIEVIDRDHNDRAGLITPASKFRMLLHTNPTRERGECLGTRAGASEDM